MADVLKAWLRTRLGVIMELTPEMFGRYTRDGTLLAQILHSYDIISSNQLSTIVRTHDPALSRVNLKTLRIWLRLINVTLSDECIEEISKGKGAAALHLFYKVYLSLEGKDRLHFIALQKERQKYVPVSSRFDVVKVCEDPPPYRPPEHHLSQPLIEATNTILWYRDKFWKIVEACRWERRCFEAAMKYPVVEPVEYFVPKVLPGEKEEEEKEEEQKEEEEEEEREKEEKSEKLDKFARKRPARRAKKKYQVAECCPGKRFLDVPFIEDPAAAAQYIDRLEKRSKRAARSHEQKLKTQVAMMTGAWETLLREQDSAFDEALGRRVLDQSRYEKQMMTKLCEIRDLRKKIVENRRIVEAMLLEARESEQRLQHDRHREIATEEIEEVEMENRRMRELRQRIREEKIRRLREQHRWTCAEIVRDLADIAVKMADYRHDNDNHIPHFVWSEWKRLFLKNQPIFELAQHFEEIEDAEDVEGAESARNEEKVKNEEKQRLVQLELERRSALADADLENYRDLASPWDEFAPTREKEVEEIPRLGRIVLGYVVHRLLQILYPYPTEVAVRPVPRVKVAAVVVGITSPALHEQLRELLKKSGMCLVRMEDAINHCLEEYKREMADVEYIDLNIVSTTLRDVRRLETKSKMDDAKERRSRRPERTPQQGETEGKQTQTPRQIPYDDMDPVLSDTAYIGKWTYEFLTLGQPISNELNTKILIEYLKSIGDIEGWVLINYPNTYEQMAMLEKALTGRVVPPDHKVIDFTDVNVEDIDPPSPRIVFKGDEADTFAICRQSRLLPNSIFREEDRRSSLSTFVTMYIKAMPKPKTLDTRAQACIPLPDDATSTDEYYADQDIAYGFYYDILEPSTMQELAELITSDRLPVKKSTFEFSEEIPQMHNGKQKPPLKPKTAVVIKRWIPKSKWKDSQCEAKEDIGIESRDLQEETKTQPASPHARPGEDGWQWLDLPQSPVLLESLAVLWESMEEAYVENLKEILSLKRIHASSVVPYKNLVSRSLTKFVERPDKRQELLHDFHRTFNEIDADLREDSDVKCELHCRITDFRAELWELCDARRHEAEEERRRILRNRWIPVEAAVLVNAYIGILQTEIDRFVDTVQLLQDYYISMSQKPLQESRFSKILFDSIELKDDLWKTSKPETIDKSAKDKEEPKVPKMKVESIRASARTSNIDHFKAEIDSLLADASKSFDPDQSTVYKAIKDDIRQARSIVDSISSTVMETLKREEKAVVPKLQIKDKGIGNASPDSTLVKLARRSRDLVEEWRYAVLFEIDRIRRRMDVLSAAARSDVIFLLDSMREIFHRIHHYIVERYKREIESIDDMANVFCFAIEGAKPIRQELLLDGERFVVRPSFLMPPEDRERITAVAVPAEAASPLRFRMAQLDRLLRTFRRIAPRGIMSERALVYVLQDLVACGEEDCYPPFVPCAWRQLRPPDIERLIERLFGTIECIEWREFIVYAMDLPVPSHRDILRARDAFRTQDPELREVIARDRCHSTPLWFLECVETSPDAQRILDENCQEDRDEMLLDEEHLHQDDQDGVTDTMFREAARLSARAIADASLNGDLIETGEDDSSATLRLTLAKELLCRMYLVNRHAVNYTAMLMAFCKDEDPREGLGKAFTLAMGGRVCTGTVEGERYVKGLVEEKRRAKEMKLSRDYLRQEANEVVQEIINYILNRTAKGIIALERKRSHDRDLTPKHRVMIQKLNGEPVEIDPADLLPAEIISEHLVVEDSSMTSDGHEYKQSAPASSMAFEGHERIQRDERVIFWLPRDVCLTVLSACLPWHASQAEVFRTSMSLREGIAHVYDELKDNELNDEDVVLAHRLVNHSFIRELLSASSKFVSKNMNSLLRNILKERDREL